MMSAPTGGFLSAQFVNVRHAAAPSRTRLSMLARFLVELPNKPVELRRNTQEDLANDVDHFAMFSINRDSPARASSEEKVAVLRRKDKAYRDALFRCGYR